MSGSLEWTFAESKIACRLLGAGMRDPVILRDLINLGAVGSDFTAPALRETWGAMLPIWKSMGRADPALVEDALASVLDNDRDARETIDWCMKAAPIEGFELPGLLDHMRQRIACRRLQNAGGELVKAAGDDYASPAKIIEGLRTKLDSIAMGSSVLRSAGAAELAAIAMERLKSGTPAFERVPSGMPLIDKALGGGMIVGRVNVVIADTGVGKSTFSRMNVVAALRAKVPSLYFTFGESERDEVAYGLIESMAGTRYPDEGVQVSRQQGGAIARAAAEFHDLPIWIEDASALTVEEVTSVVRAHRNAYGIKAVFLDYVQDVEATAHGKRDDLAYVHISRTLRTLAKNERLALIEYSQLADAKPGEKIGPKHTAFSKQFGRDAATVVILERDTEAKNPDMRDVTRAALRKNRITGKLVEEFFRFDHASWSLISCGPTGEPLSTVDVPGYGPPRDDLYLAWDGDDA
jgi:replicative DNA helicase